MVPATSAAILLGALGAAQGGERTAARLPELQPTSSLPTPSVPAPQVPAVPVPDVPAVTTPDAPGVPTPDVPAVTTPDVPATGTPGLPRTPGGGAPSIGSGSGSGGGGGGSTSRAGSGGGSAGSGSASSTSPGDQAGPASERRAAARSRTPAERRRTARSRRAARAKRLRARIERLQGCLGSLPEADQRLLTLRAGLDGGSPRSTAQIAQELGIEPGQVGRAQRRALRRLGRASRSTPCGAPSVGGAPVAGDNRSAAHARCPRPTCRA